MKIESPLKTGFKFTLGVLLAQLLITFACLFAFVLMLGALALIVITKG